MRADVKTVNHHGSHRRLLWLVEESTRSAKVDAIIVPTARPVSYLEEATAAARALRCPLVTLHSRQSNAGEAVSSLDPTIDLIAIDVPESAQLGLPVLQTSLLLAGGIFERQTDVSTKRNLALLLSHMLRWKRVVFLDDDIKVPKPRDLSKAVSLLDAHNAVGLGIGGFPDNSAVCHAFREAGGSQDTFIGAGAMAVDVERNRTFFPNIYNEDWFFVLDAGKGLQPVASVGRVIQNAYNPYKAERAAAEEFGDVLAEGTFWLFDQGKPVSAGDLEHWEAFLVKRKKFIEQVLSMVGSSPKIEKARGAQIAEALMASLDRLELISPDLCVGYLEALAHDQEQWQRHIQAIRQQGEPPLMAAGESLARGSGTSLEYHVRKAAPSQRRRTPPALGQTEAGELVAASAPASPFWVLRMLTAMWAMLRLAAPSSHAAHALEAAKVALPGQEGQAERDDYSDERPSQQLHV